MTDSDSGEPWPVVARLCSRPPGPTWLLLRAPIAERASCRAACGNYPARRLRVAHGRVHNQAPTLGAAKTAAGHRRGRVVPT
jgi:hypothetical protein